MRLSADRSADINAFSLCLETNEVYKTFLREIVQLSFDILRVGNASSSHFPAIVDTLEKCKTNANVKLDMSLRFSTHIFKRRVFLDLDVLNLSRILKVWKTISFHKSLFSDHPTVPPPQ